MGEEKITQEKLNKFLELDKDTQDAESKMAYKAYKLLERQKKDIEEEIESLKRTLELRKIDTQKEKQDVENISIIENFVAKQDFDVKLQKEHAEYLEALNKEQNIEKRLQGLTKQHEDVNEKMKQMAPSVEKFEKKSTELNNLLSEIFEGSYGSDLENQLESDYTIYLEKLERVQFAKYKWLNGRNLLHNAYRQMQTATERWDLLVKTPDPKGKFQICTEARNNIVAAIQNLRSSQRYLENITFPYCKSDEITTMERAVNNIYSDMMSVNRHEHASTCYKVTFKRLGALIQWFDKVINDTILVDLKNIRQTERETHKALKLERFRLMKEKLEKDGHKIDIDASALSKDDDLDEEVQIVLAKPETTEEDDKLGQEKRPAPTPVPLKDLAPIPSEEEMFGNIEQLKKQHEKECQDLQKTQDMNKARLQQGLEEKLAARRRKRDMQSV